MGTDVVEGLTVGGGGDRAGKSNGEKGRTTITKPQ